MTLTLSSGSIHRSESLHEQTYKTLRTAILSGELASGERLIETQLAQMLQVSRTPIREALRQLQRENLVTDTSAGLRVAALSIADAVYLYDCRIALEQLSVAEACQNVTPKQLEKLDFVVQQAENVKDQQLQPLTNYQLLHMDYNFHRLLAESSGNPWLVSLLDQLFDKMALLRIRTMQQNPGVLEIRSEHRRIYLAVVERNQELAAAAIKEHLIASKARVVREIKQLQQKSNFADFV
ncbi:GntR family transcriptional regulator [Kamptonema sp. UHCC 0994]|uniref:GntR family transcriptional regulator n=1 Tax=Kamptonema sp. UHCC 0994 TaxID=3031329 RepID=UPI0023BA154D|nr:GntR family transcriptional regulator [Kamptonema sp. UHCC 0994]MDF0552554.1 GntR family transcriptional regulator [Kamptonema sp. UHCC 0994]